MCAIPLPSYTDFFHLLKIAQDEVKKLTRKQQEKRLYGALGNYDNPLLTKFLRWKYSDYDMLQRGDNIYPTVIFKAPVQQQLDLESVLFKPLAQPCKEPKQFVTTDCYFRVLVKALGLPLYDAPNYAMASLIHKGKLQLTCELGYYYYTLDTCFSLLWEILSKLNKIRGDTDDDFKRFDKELELRTGLHRVCRDPIVTGTGRSAAIGISTLVAYNDGLGFKLWLKTRSTSGVAVYPGLVNVLPSGMFEPAVGKLDEEFSVRHNVFREYLEEVFDIPEAKGEEAYDYFYNNPRLEFLCKFLGLGFAQLFLTGVAVDLLSLRPEICTLLLIRTPEWYSYHAKAPVEQGRFSLSSEFFKRHPPETVRETLLTTIPFSKKDSELLRYECLSASKMTPSGAGVFWLGVDTLKKVL